MLKSEAENFAFLLGHILQSLTKTKPDVWKQYCADLKIIQPNLDWSG